MVDAHDNHEEELQHLKNKVAILKDHSIRNNMGFIGIQETTKPNEIISYLPQTHSLSFSLSLLMISSLIMHIESFSSMLRNDHCQLYVYLPFL